MTIGAEHIIAALATRHGDSLWATELAFSGGARRCDFWTISPNGSSGFLAIAYEVKISRGDFKRDHSGKQREARLFSDRFYYATPAGLIDKAEVPDWAGLIEFDGAGLTVRVPAPLRDKSCPTWELVVSLIRNSGEIRRDVSVRERERLHFKRQVETARQKLREAGHQPWMFGLDG